MSGTTPDNGRPEDPYDPAADTASFRAFVEREEPGFGPAEQGRSRAFRVLTLLAGLAVLGALAWILLFV